MSNEKVKEYNYTEFVLSEELKPFAEFGSAPNAGAQAPDFPLENLETGETINTGDLWKRELVIMEFGSFT